MKRTLSSRIISVLSLFFIALPVYSGSETAPLAEEEYFADIPIVLTATRLAQPATEAPAAITIIDREMIKASGAREIADLFRLVPGFVVSHENGYTPIVMYHGLSDEYARRMQVLIDGRSVYSPSGGGVEWTNLPLTVDDIERIEIIRGPNAASYGSNSFLSIINIITLHSSDTTGTFDKITRGTNNIGDVYMRHGNSVENFSYQISVGYNHDDGFDNRDDARTVQLARFRSDYQASAVDTVMVQVGTNNGTRELHEYTLKSTIDRKINDHFAQIRWAHQIDNDEEFSLQFFYNAENKIEFFDVTTPDLAPIPVRVIADNTVHGERYDLELQHNLSFNTNTRMVWGLGLRQDSASGVDVFGTNAATGYTGGKKIFYSKILRAFANIESRFFDKLIVNAGAMLEKSDLADNQFSPRLGLNYLFNTNHSVRLTASHATRSPTIRESYDNYRVPIYDTADPPSLMFVTTLWKGSLKLKPEVITAYELGYHANFGWKRSSFDLKLYREELRDLISPDDNQIADPSDLVDGQYEVVGNFTDSDITGAEISIGFKPTKTSRFILSHSRINIESRNPNISSDLLAESAPEIITSLLMINRFPGNVTGSFLYTSASKSNGLGSG
ncbi:MAG: TonB-dependent receptor, partial [Gammaproteobacteria bacterium]